MSLRPSLFLKEFILFALTLLLGIIAAHYLSFSTYAAQPIQFSPSDLIFLAVIILFFIALYRFKPIARWSFKIFLALIVLSGTQILASMIMPSPWDFLFAVLVLILFIVMRNVLFHNLGVILGISGLCAVIGVGISATVGVVLLVLFSIYDIIAVYRTKHMIRLAENMVESGAIFGFIIPSEFRSFRAKTYEAKQKIGDQFMILGSGDIGLPLIFAAAVAKSSLSNALIVAVFSIIGLFITHLIFINQEKRKPMAALPPIATMSIIGYLVVLLIR